MAIVDHGSSTERALDALTVIETPGHVSDYDEVVCSVVTGVDFGNLVPSRLETLQKPVVGA